MKLFWKFWFALIVLTSCYETVPPPGKPVIEANNVKTGAI